MQPDEPEKQYSKEYVLRKQSIETGCCQLQMKTLREQVVAA